ncbi:armadillo-type protein [Dunaliella salina]|uniref:Armadillo-type protein n=1 Tax=Dunaliella salina TaxID=3046 RepID=A0ABQ7H8E4_DUNSA|nr:armadillo-type protein [Dunaliella salina]|eukprot:KAF5843130.1 armadillo-type protein [Dunaliella salina]
MLCEQRPESPPYFDPRLEASAPPTPTQLLPSTPSNPQEILGRALQALPSVRSSLTDSHTSVGTPGSPAHMPPHLSSLLPMASRTADHAPAVQSRLSNNTAAETTPALAVPHTLLHTQQSLAGLSEQEEESLSASPLGPPSLFAHRSQSNTQPQSPASHAQLPGSPFSRTVSMDSNHASALHTFAAAPTAPQAASAMGSVGDNGGPGSRAASGVHSTIGSPSQSGPLPPTPPVHPPSPTPQQLQSMYMAMAAAGSMPAPAGGVMPHGPMGLGGYNTAASSMPMTSTAAAASSALGYPPFLSTAMPPLPSAFPFGAPMPPPSPPMPGLMPPMGGMGMPPPATGPGYFPSFDAAGQMDVAAMAAASGAGGAAGLGGGMVPPMFPPPMPTPFPSPGMHGMPHLLNPVEYAKYYQKMLETQGMGSGGFASPANGQGNGMAPWELAGAGGNMRAGGGGGDVHGGMGTFGSSAGYHLGGRGMHAHHHHGGGGKDGFGVSNGGGGNVRPNRMSAFEHVQHARVPGKGGGDGHGHHHHHHHHGRHGGGGGVNANGVSLHQGGGRGGRGHRKDDTGMSNRGQPLTLLEEFKASKANKFEFKDIMGHLHEFALDQHGSRFIQQRLEVVSSDELEAALAEVLPHGTSLMTDVFGNYVMQKFLEHGSQECREKVAGVLKGQVLSLSLQMYGCRVMQKALEVLEVDTQCSLIAELDGNIMRCVRDQNGNHVVQKIIECVPTERITGLIGNFLTCVVPLSTHPFGCRVIQRVLEHCQDADRKAVVMMEILKEACHLARDQYGNYVIQHVLEHGQDSERKQIVNSLAPEVVSMSMHKFASNVIEKCLAHGSTQDRDLMVSWEVCRRS